MSAPSHRIYVYDGSIFVCIMHSLSLSGLILFVRSSQKQNQFESKEERTRKRKRKIKKKNNMHTAHELLSGSMYGALVSFMFISCDLYKYAARKEHCAIQWIDNICPGCDFLHFSCAENCLDFQTAAFVVVVVVDIAIVKIWISAHLCVNFV